MIAVAVLLTVHALTGRLRGGTVELRRLPERQFDLRIDINRANEIELQHLPGVGPKMAAKIVADRAANGPFATVAELRRVKGIGPKTLEALIPFLVDPPKPIEPPTQKRPKKIDGDIEENLE